MHRSTGIASRHRHSFYFIRCLINNLSYNNWNLVRGSMDIPTSYAFGFFFFVINFNIGFRVDNRLLNSGIIPFLSDSIRCHVCNVQWAGEFVIWLLRWCCWCLSYDKRKIDTIKEKLKRSTEINSSMDFIPYNITWHCDDLKLSVAAVCQNNLIEFPKNKHVQNDKKKN